MDMGYALLQNNIMSFEFDGGEYNSDISSNTLGMIEFYEPNLYPSQQTNDRKHPLTGNTINMCQFTPESNASFIK